MRTGTATAGGRWKMEQTCWLLAELVIVRRTDCQHSVAEIEVEARLRRYLIDNLRAVSTVTAMLMHFFLNTSVSLPTQ